MSFVPTVSQSMISSISNQHVNYVKA